MVDSMGEHKNQHSESSINLNGINFHYVETGPDDGQLVIFLHGFPEFWYGWRSQLVPLSDAGYRVIALDQRGYNLSDKPRDLTAYRLEECTQDVVNLIRALGREKAVVVGHDWGGFVAWWLGIAHPEVVEKLVILNAPHPKVIQTRVPLDPPQWIHSLYVFFFQLTGLTEAVLRTNDWQPLVDAMEGTSRPGTFSAEDIEQYRRAWWKKDAMTSMLNWYRANFRMPPSLPNNVRVSVPTLMLWGVKDSALGRELAQPSIDLCDMGELIFFEEATHWLQHEESEAINRYIIDFLK